MVLVAAVAAVVAAVGVWTARPQAEPVRGLPAVAVDGAAARRGGGCGRRAVRCRAGAGAQAGAARGREGGSGRSWAAGRGEVPGGAT